MLGVRPDDLIGRPSPFHVGPDVCTANSPCLHEPAMLALHTGRAQPAVTVSITSANGTRWFKVTAEPLVKVDGVSVYAAVTRFESVPPPRPPTTA
jgi:hypothetical protein